MIFLTWLMLLGTSMMVYRIKTYAILPAGYTEIDCGLSTVASYLKHGSKPGDSNTAIVERPAFFGVKKSFDRFNINWEFHRLENKKYGEINGYQQDCCINTDVVHRGPFNFFTHGKFIAQYKPCTAPQDN
jgi:hypothetical protein